MTARSMTVALFSMMVLHLSAAASDGRVESASPAPSETTPSCRLKAKCDAMWLAAMDAVGGVTGMRNRVVTDSRIETYAAQRYSTLTGIVSKMPIAGGGYEISLRLECFRNSDCGDLPIRGVKLFNLMVNGAGLRFNAEEVRAFSSAPGSDQTLPTGAASAASEGTF